MNCMKYEIRSAIGEVITLISSQKYDDNTQQIHNNKASHLQGELNKRFGGSTQMLSIYENAKCSDEICAALLGRVKIAQEVVRSLQCELQVNEENFRNQDYQYDWFKFIFALENIK
ncbi:1043_t:CDS:2, partial [Dentiscutata erythropus]